MKKNNSDIFVSCIIPTYKRVDTLIRAIHSALAQTHKNIEVIIVDDNIPGDTYSQQVQKALKAIYDTRVRYISQSRHINGAVARNTGIINARGKYVAFLDDDDEWHPDKIEKQLDFLKVNTDCDGCSCLYTFLKNGKTTRKSRPYSNDNLQFKILNRSIRIFTSTVLLDREVLIAAGKFDEELIRHQDLQMLADFSSVGKIAVLNDYLVKIHQDSRINRIDTQQTIEIKQKYLDKMQRHISAYSKKDQRRIYGIHNFEIFIRAVKEKKFAIAFKYLRKVGWHLSVYMDFVKRVFLI